ncbi:MAG: hypothetical protein JWN56_1983 [Sphingobacteriales bacterium]|nr:hypothetical protein [Sphingobacteriales bacterium]
MKVYLKISTLFLLVLFFSCSKSDDLRAKQTSIVGKWKIKQVLANDHWGAPLNWRPATLATEIEFTSDMKFYRHEDVVSSFISVGTYTLLSDSTLKIVSQDTNGIMVPQTLRYSFEDGGYLNLMKNQFEGVVGEKFEIEK